MRIERTFAIGFQSIALSWPCSLMEICQYRRRPIEAQLVGDHSFLHRAWGVGINRHKAFARLAAIGQCRAHSAGAADDCDARAFVVAEPTLTEDQLYARYRVTDMRFTQNDGIGMPRRNLVAVSKAGI